jgi:hypothetical protein
MPMQLEGIVLAV